MMESTKHIIDILLGFWEWFAVIVGGFILRFLLSRAVKSYTQELEEMKEDILSVKQDIKAIRDANFLPRSDADKVVADVRREHEKMFEEASKQHAQQREDFKHIENRIDASNKQINEILQILVEKLH